MRLTIKRKLTLRLFSAGCVLLIAILSSVISVSILKLLNNANSVVGASEKLGYNMSSGVAASEQTSTNIGIVASADEEINATLEFD